MGASDRFMNRVVVSGRGVLSAIGCGVPAFARSLQQGTGGIAAFEDGTRRIGARVGSFAAGGAEGATELATLDRATQFALVCAREAVAESGLDLRTGLGPRAAVIVGNGSGCLHTIEAGYNNLFAQPPRRLHPLTVPRIMPNAMAGHISLEFGVSGPSFTLAAACASSAYAVMMGAQLIRTGAVDVAIVGGAEACLTEGNLKAWEALRVLAPDTCRPFSKGRRGLVLGEGGAMLVLESLDHARARSAPVRGEIAGGALNSDAYHLLAPSLDGQSEAIRACLRDAQMAEDDVGYVNAHGTATAANDVTETRALRRIFGMGADRLQVSSTKSMHGHTLGAAGSIELLATLIGLELGFSPPTMNFTEPDPECDLNYVPNEAQEMRARAALTNSFAFGGHNAVLAVRAPQAV